MYKLYDMQLKDDIDRKSPLADRMRPQNLREFLGQKHLVKDGGLLKRAIIADKLGSCVFYGPPGTGKTTLANIIANSTSGNFVKLNAVTSGVADIKKAVESAEKDLKNFGTKTYLLLDECHRFNKAQQDSLLPSIEKGTIIFIGSTTENPYVALTPAIISRCRIFEFRKLSKDDIKLALIKALKDEKKGLGKYNAIVEGDAIEHFATICDGDLRTAYNGLELAVTTTEKNEKGELIITLKDAEESISKKALSVDENLYYHLLSAFCKSLRGSDSNAALYYSQRLIKAGVDPIIIARRLIAHASEDVGLADPNAMVIATSSLIALQNLGVPEGLLSLSQGIIYVAEARKSNSVVVAMQKASFDAENNKDDNVPSHLINPVYMSKEDKMLSKNYKYPHDYGEYVRQQYLPDSLKDRIYYEPTDHGYEKQIKINRKIKEETIKK